MDPDKALEILRELAEKILSPISGSIDEEAREMAIEFEALDKWLMRGGFPPKEWTPFKY